jgi:hypothetical protein
MLSLRGRPNALLQSHVLWDTLYIVCMLTHSYNTCNNNIFSHLYMFNAKDDSKLKKHFNRTVDDIWVENLGVGVEEPFYVQRCVTFNIPVSSNVTQVKVSPFKTYTFHHFFKPHILCMLQICV